MFRGELALFLGRSSTLFSRLPWIASFCLLLVPSVEVVLGWDLAGTSDVLRALTLLCSSNWFSFSFSKRTSQAVVLFAAMEIQICCDVLQLE